MREWVEARVRSDELLRCIPRDLGKELPTGTRVIRLARDSAKWQRLVPILGTCPNGFSSWVTRRYAEKELAEAELLRLIITKAFEPVGDDCGTLYDESDVCPYAGRGADR